METNNLEELYGSYKNYHEVVTNTAKETVDWTDKRLAKLCAYAYCPIQGCLGGIRLTVTVSSKMVAMLMWPSLGFNCQKVRSTKLLFGGPRKRVSMLKGWASLMSLVNSSSLLLVSYI